jgi:hypothetical protein
MCNGVTAQNHFFNHICARIILSLSPDASAEKYAAEQVAETNGIIPDANIYL